MNSGVKLCIGSGKGPCPQKAKIRDTPGYKRCLACAYDQQKYVGSKEYRDQRAAARPKPKAARKTRVPRAKMPVMTAWACTRCGCTERMACWPTCSWVAFKLCDACATPQELLAYDQAEKAGQLAQILSTAPGQWRPKAVKKKVTLSSNGVRMGRPPKKKPDYKRNRKRPAWSRQPKEE